MTILFFILAINLNVFAPVSPRYLIIECPPEIKPYELLWKAVCKVESGNNPLAYNIKENAVGICQIRPVKLNHYNKLTGNHYTLSQMYDKEISKSIFMYFAMQYSDYETICIQWNGKSKHNHYWQKVKTQLRYGN